MTKFDCVCDPEWLTLLDALMVAMDLPSRAAVLETLAFAQSRRSHQYADERLIKRYFEILTLAESSAQIGAPDSCRELPLSFITWVAKPARCLRSVCPRCRFFGHVHRICKHWPTQD